MAFWRKSKVGTTVLVVLVVLEHSGWHALYYEEFKPEFYGGPGFSYYYSSTSTTLRHWHLQFLVVSDCQC